MNMENDLRDAFTRTAATVVPRPEPYQRLIALRQRRARRRLGLAGVLAVALVAAGLAGGGRLLRPQQASGPPPIPWASQPAPADFTQLYWLDATDAGHLYASVFQCRPTRCGTALMGSDDGGRTWTTRSYDAPAVPTVLPNGALVGWLSPAGTVAVIDRDLRISMDGGRSWTRIVTVTQPVASVPAGGVTVCPMVYDTMMRCTVYAVDLARHRAAPLAQQPSLAALSAQVGDGAVWVMGRPRGNPRGTAMAVSRDAGRTWHTATVDTSCAPETDVLPWHSGTAGQVTCTPGSPGARRLYRTDDYGSRWHRVPLPQPLPFVRDGDPAGAVFAPDGTLVGYRSPHDGSVVRVWTLSRDAGSWQPMPDTGTTAVNGSIVAAATGGGLLLYELSAAPGKMTCYRTTDLRTWTSITIPAAR
jgi:photosystem II stability/assembly factor-like uncharacterized protein